MNSANQVSKLIAELKSSGIPLSDVAWQTALACVGWPYVFGARGEYCDPPNRRSRARADHPTIESSCRNFHGSDATPGKCVGCNWFLADAEAVPETHEGRVRFFDCRGFTYWILYQVTGQKLQGAGATSQWNTESNWTAKGTIDTMPKNTLVCLFVRNGSKMEHTGFGLNDETVECSVGVQHFKKRNKKWTHWALPACLGGAVPAPDPDKRPTLRQGDSGPYVVQIQTALIDRGYHVGSNGADGKFGRNTRSAVVAFQANNGLTADGICGPVTWSALDADPAGSLYTVHLPHLSKAKAEAMVAAYAGGAYMTPDENEK